MPRQRINSRTCRERRESRRSRAQFRAGRRETPHRQACWQWLTYLTEQPAAVQGYPARISLAESPTYRQLVGEELASAYAVSIQDAATPSSLKALDEDEWLAGALYWLYQANGDVLSGEMSAQEALDAAQALVDDYEACVIAGGYYTTKAWQACLQQTDPSLPAFLFPSSD